MNQIHRLKATAVANNLNCNIFSFSLPFFIISIFSHRFSTSFLKLMVDNFKIYPIKNKKLCITTVTRTEYDIDPLNGSLKRQFSLSPGRARIVERTFRLQVKEETVDTSLTFVRCVQVDEVECLQVDENLLPSNHKKRKIVRYVLLSMPKVISFH